MFLSSSIKKSVTVTGGFFICSTAAGKVDRSVCALDAPVPDGGLYRPAVQNHYMYW